MNLKRIAVFGYNRRSYELATRLDKTGHELIIIDSDSDRAALAAEQGFNTATFDYRSDEDLKNAGIGSKIDILFCFFAEDSENVFLTISARAMDQELEIIAIVDNPDSADKLIAAGANKIIDPYEISGRKFYQLVKNPDIVNILDHTVFGQYELNIAEIVVPAGSYLENMKASQLELQRRYNLILIGVVDKELGEDLYFFIGEKEHKLDAGDILIILGPTSEIQAFKNEVEKEGE